MRPQWFKERLLVLNYCNISDQLHALGNLFSVALAAAVSPAVLQQPCSLSMTFCTQRRTYCFPASFWWVKHTGHWWPFRQPVYTRCFWCLSSHLKRTHRHWSKLQRCRKKKKKENCKEIKIWWVWQILIISQISVSI